MKLPEAHSIDSSSSKKTSAGGMLKSIIAIAIFTGLIFLLLNICYSGGIRGQFVAGIIAVFMASNFLFSKRENIAKNNAALLGLALLVTVLVTLVNAIALGRPLSRTDGFFNAAGVDFHHEKLAYSKGGEAFFRIALTTEEFEKLVDFYREEAQERLQDGGDFGGSYGWGYFELEPSSINRDALLNMKREQFSSHLEKLETTKDDLVDGYWLKSGIEDLMEGFPEFGEDLGRCRAVIWYSPEVTREFYWFEKQQKGYIDP